MKYIYSLCSLLLLFGVFLFGYHLLRGDLLFHTDISRDFLLIEDMIDTHKLAFIGPRAGGIPGVFFGPIWMYLNTPAFLIGNGNPLVIGYFWLVLMIVGLGGAFYVAKKVFSFEVAFYATTIFIYSVLFLAPGFTQSFLPIIISPVALYCVFLFVEKKKKRYLAWSAFMSGLLLQAQPAFGSIFLFTTLILSVVLLFKRKKIRYLLVWFAALIPLSTYIIFELRHNFLETRAFIAFITNPTGQSWNLVSLFSRISDRLQGFLSTLSLTGTSSLFMIIFFVAIFGMTFYLWYRSKHSSERTFIMLIGIYYAGFWLITLLFTGVVWDYYHWGFYPLLAILFASLALKVNKKIFFLLFSFGLGILIYNGINTVIQWQKNIMGRDTSSWILNREIAEYVYQDAKEDFGYYIYSPNEYGYSKKYAMSYVGRAGKYPESGVLCTKKHSTYLIYNPVGTSEYTDPVYWKNKKVNITGKPVSRKSINKIVIEKYILDQKQTQIASDQNIICDLQFR